MTHANANAKPITPADDPRGATAAVLSLLDQFAHQRPGFEFGNYATAADYRRDYRETLQHLHDFEAMHDVAERLNETGELPYALVPAAFRRAFSGRLELLTHGEDGGGWPFRLDYTAGQYAPIEYRAAACAVLADLLWQIEGEAGAHSIRETARDRFGLGIARRWFDYR